MGFISGWKGRPLMFAQYYLTLGGALGYVKRVSALVLDGYQHVSIGDIVVFFHYSYLIKVKSHQQ